MKYTTIFLVIILIFCAQLGMTQTSLETRQLEAKISKGIESAFKTSIQISPYDTLSKRAQQAVFSGVVVTAEGHILTVAHATKPNQIYQITFPDGTKYLAKGLGRMAIKQDGRDLDMAMIKITQPGIWAFAPLGSSEATKLSQPVLSISYPGSFHYKLPNVRFGRLTNADISTGYITSTCKMEPGDSGGPLFDLQGRVLGLHSWIKNNEDENYEVPIDLYKKYWSALNVAEDYKELPKADSVILKTDTTGIAVIGNVQNLIGSTQKKAENTLVIKSKRGLAQLEVLGTAIAYISSSGRREVYVVSKSSMVADSVVLIVNGRNMGCDVVRRNKENDLVLLKPRNKLKNPIVLRDNQDKLNLTNNNLGHFMFSTLDDYQIKVGVLSSLYLSMPMRFSIGNFGANARFIDQKITITNIARGGGASELIRVNDQITSINGVAISKPAEYGAELQKYLAGDSITVDLIRATVPMQVKVYLPSNPGANHVATKFAGGRSPRSDGFKNVLVHDAAIRMEECGGPVFNAEGTFYGINIARHSRTSTIIMPVDEIIEFLKEKVNT